MAERSTSVRNLVILAVVVVTAFVLATVLGLGGSDGDDATTTTSTTTTTAPTTTTTTAPTTTTTAVVVPDGDYAAVCGELQAKLAAFAGDATVEGFTTLFESLDFDLLVRASTRSSASSRAWIQPTTSPASTPRCCRRTTTRRCHG